MVIKSKVYQLVAISDGQKRTFNNNDGLKDTLRRLLRTDQRL